VRVAYGQMRVLQGQIECPRGSFSGWSRGDLGHLIRP
jgi:hypothetical protein